MHLFYAGLLPLRLTIFSMDPQPADTGPPPKRVCIASVQRLFEAAQHILEDPSLCVADFAARRAQDLAHNSFADLLCRCPDIAVFKASNGTSLLYAVAISPMPAAHRAVFADYLLAAAESLEF